MPKKNHCEEMLFDFVAELLDWLVENRKEAVYILYFLEICSMLIDCEDDREANERYQSKMVPLYQKIHDDFYAKRQPNLALSERYLLYYLYNEFEVELDSPPDGGTARCNL